MSLGLVTSRQWQSKPVAGEELGEGQQEHEEQDEAHDDDVMADACAYLQPTAVILHQEEEMLPAGRNTRGQLNIYITNARKTIMNSMSYEWLDKVCVLQWRLFTKTVPVKGSLNYYRENHLLY